MKTILIVLGASLVGGLALGQSPAPPLLQAHAHNDYEHQRPLLDALDHGFCSVEADVWLVNGQLLVAHDLKDAQPDRTLQRLYLDPLRRRVQDNAGRVYLHGPSVLLLVDAKSEATNTYAAIKKALEPYRAILTVYHRDRTETNAVSVVISGNRARDWMASETERLAAYDGRLSDLDNNSSPHFIPLISDNWRLHFRWNPTAGSESMEREDGEKLRSIVRRAHARGQRVRFWGMADTPVVWQALREAEVDLINTDDLERLSQFLREKEKPKSAKP